MINALSETTKLIIVVLFAVLFVVMGDTIGKVLTTSGVEPFIVAWSRFLIATLIILPFSGLKVSELKFLLEAKVIMRAAFITGAIFFIISALKTEPIANVLGGFFIGPIISYVLAVVLLKEKPSRLQTGLLILGFIGVIIVVKPGFGASTGMVLSLLAGTCYGAYLASTKMIAADFRPRFLLFSQLCIGSIILTPFGILNDIEIPNFDVNIYFLLIGSAVFSAAGNYLLVIANRMADASLIAPLVYSQLIYGAIFGIVVFGDVPDASSTLGLLLISLSGFGSLLLFKRKSDRGNIFDLRKKV